MSQPPAEEPRHAAEGPRRGTIQELEDWERNGAEWRPVEISSGRAMVDLCSCTGELMERVVSDDPQFVEFVRSRRAA